MIVWNLVFQAEEVKIGGVPLAPLISTKGIITANKSAPSPSFSLS
jgi:hypothetical protein